ncbi:MAG: maleylpyruvate isomerase N-terminal domain-containing protein [Cellulomonas sp.]
MLTDEQLTELSDTLHTQWSVLRRWLDAVDEAVATEAPSVLEGWTVADLIAHVGRSMSALVACEPALDGTVPLTLGGYVGSYAAGADAITATTHALAAQIVAAPLPGIDALAAAAFDRLDALGPSDRVVLARRGPILLSSMVTTRLIELVVHADDLQRSLGRPGAEMVGLDGGVGVEDGPIDRTALDLVARALLDVVVAHGGWDLEIVRPLTWVRLAAGRVPYDVDVLAEALSPRYSSDGVPDLGRILPIL